MRGVAVALAALAAAPAANAGCPVHVSRERGAAPLRVAFRADCVSKAYRWRFGDGTTARGRAVVHTFRAGRFTPVLRTKGRGARRLGPVTSIALRLVAPRTATYAQHVTLRATVVPKLPVTVAGRLFRGGRLTLTVADPRVTAVAGGVAVRAAIRLRPVLDVRLAGERTIGAPLRVVAVLRPAHAGSVSVRVDGATTDVVDTSGVHTARIVVTSEPRPGWAAAARVVRAHVQAPALALGDRGPAVTALERRLRGLGYAVHDEAGVFDEDVWQSVVGFQDANRLAPTGDVTAALWTRLARAAAPQARYAGDHVEVDKTRQVLFLVRGGRVVLVTHVSTGATGNTPVGLWHVYGKVPGWSWVLWYPSYFLRGFAIHGYPDVPAYPASHGCVRVPMWLAPGLYAQIPLGSAIYVYV
jgi:peptidoglycan hydrolase-like protein with peptidoglycan-binding domain